MQSGIFLDDLATALHQWFQPVVRVPPVVREGLSVGTPVTPIFSQKPGFTVF